LNLGKFLREVVLDVNNWVTLNGTTNNEKGIIQYVPKKLVGDTEEGAYEFCTVKSDHFFKEGELSFDIKISSENSGAQLILCWGNPLYISFNVGSSAYSIHTYNQQQEQQKESSRSSGSKDSIKVGQTYKVKVSVKGSVIKYFVDNVEVLESVYATFKSALAFNFYGDDEVIISNVKVKDYKPKAFVVMQFTERFNELYEGVIKPVCDEFQIEVIRADDFHTNGFIINDIINSIKEASVIIAEITPDNPNVYYEVGFAHASNKHVILLCNKDRKNLPFDLSGFRTIFYNDSISGKDRVEATLAKHLENIFPIS